MTLSHSNMRILLAYEMLQFGRINRLGSEISTYPGYIKYNSNIVSRVTFKAQHPATNVQWRPSKKGFHFVLSLFLRWKFQTSFIWCGTRNYLLPNNKVWLTKYMLDSRWWVQLVFRLSTVHLQDAILRIDHKWNYDILHTALVIICHVSWQIMWL